MVPLPLGATRITSTPGGGTTWVCSLYTTEKPCANMSVLPGVTYFFSAGHSDFWPASDSRYMITVPLSAATSTGNSVLPGTHPSATAAAQEEPAPPSRRPTITFKPLSRALSACPRPCVP